MIRFVADMSPAAVSCRLVWGARDVNVTKNTLSKKNNALHGTGSGRHGAKTSALASLDRGWASAHGNDEMRRSRRAFVGGAAAQRRGERGGGVASQENNNNPLSVVSHSSSSRGIADGVRCRASLLAGTQGWDEGGAYQGKRTTTAGYDAVDDVSDEAAQGAVTSNRDGPEGAKRDAGEIARLEQRKQRNWLLPVFVVFHSLPANS